jgi:hypothetical protein
VFLPSSSFLQIPLPGQEHSKFKVLEDHLGYSDYSKGKEFDCVKFLLDNCITMQPVNILDSLKSKAFEIFLG